MGWDILAVLKGQLTVQMLMQGTLGPEVDAGSQDMRETWMLLEYADRGNLDRALVQKKMMTADDCLDLVSAPTAASPTCSALRPHQHAGLSIYCSGKQVVIRRDRQEGFWSVLICTLLRACLHVILGG